MKNKFLIYFFALFIFSLPCYSDITGRIIWDNDPPFGGLVPDLDTNVNTILYDFSVSLNSIASFVSDSFSLATVNSTPIGVKKISNFSLGLSINPAVSFDKLKFYEDNFTNSAGSLPKIGAGINVSIFFGISLGERFDLFVSAIYLPKQIFNMIKYKPEGFDISIMSAGLKLRYSLLSENKKQDFSGITVSPGVYWGYNTLTYKNTINQTSTYNTGITFPPGYETGTLSLTNLDMNVKVIVITFDLEIMFYFNFIKIINVFAGFGGSLSLSYLNMDSNITVSNDISGNVESGRINLTGKTSGSKVIPRIVFGTEINLFVRILIQGVISWSKGQGLFGGTFAFRFEF